MFGLFETNLEDVATELDSLMTEMAKKYLNVDPDTVYQDARNRYEDAYHHGDNIEVVVAGLRDFNIRVHHESYDEEGENTISFATGLNSAYEGLMLVVSTSGSRMAMIEENPMGKITSRARKLEKILTIRYGFKNPKDRR